MHMVLKQVVENAAKAIGGCMHAFLVEQR